MTKQETIQQAYGEYSDIALELCDENGWIKHFDYHTYFPQDTEKERVDGYFCMRPKSLQGIEDNNGWLDLPTKEFLEYGFYFVKVRIPLTKFEEIFVHEIKDGAGIIPYQYAIQYKKIELKLPLYHGL